jgi:hypothetical protein
MHLREQGGRRGVGVREVGEGRERGEGIEGERERGERREWERWPY